MFDGVNTVCYETPGHNPSCLTFELGNWLFIGDAYIPGVKVVTMLPHSDKSKAKESVERILKLAGGRTVMPGHDDQPPEWSLRYSLEASTVRFKGLIRKGIIEEGLTIYEYFNCDN